MTAKAAAPPDGRIRSLDGLRGIASVVVLVHHCLLTLAPLANPYMVDEWSGGESLIADMLIVSPLHLLWDGGAAVWVFFVLSGIVLTLPVIRADRFDWLRYYSMRLVRLYLPIWAAVALAAMLIAVSNRSADRVDSLWLSGAATEVTPHRLTMDLTLLGGNGGLSSPLWSLQWEIVFSLFLPVFVWVAVKFRRQAALLGAGAVAVIAVGGYLNQGLLQCMPIFAVGALIAVRLPDLSRLASRLSAHRGRWAAVILFALVLIWAPWMMRGTALHAQIVGVVGALAVIGAAVLVVAAIHAPGLRRFLELRPVQYLGTVSFSLYLTHEPILVTLTMLLGDGMQWVAIPVAVALSFVVAHVFYALVEKRSHRLARSIGRFVGSRRRSRESVSGTAEI